MAMRIERRFDDSGNLIEDIYDNERKIGSSITKYDIHRAEKSKFDESGKHIVTTRIWWDYETDREVVHTTPGQCTNKPAGHWQVYVIQKGIRDDYRWIFVPAYQRPPVRSNWFDIKKTADLTAMILPMLIGLGFALYHMPPLRLWSNWCFTTTIEWAYAGPIGMLIGSAIPYLMYLVTGRFSLKKFGNLSVLVLLLAIFPALFTILGWVVISVSHRIFGLNSLGVQVMILVLYLMMMLALGSLAWFYYKDSKGYW